MKFIIISLLYSISLFGQDSGKAYIEDFLKTYDKEPSSFKQFIEDINKSQFSGSAQVNSVDFPVSRSLQKNNTSYKFPRQVVSVSVSTDRPESSGFNFSSSRNDDPQMFFGYAPEAGSLEVISWNPSEKKYEFFQVENFGPGKKPILVKPDEKTCIKCHQAGGPIFTHFPWSESSQTIDNNVSGRHVQKSQEARAQMTEEELRLHQFATAPDDLNFLSDIFRIDGNVRNANKKMAFAIICEDINNNLNKEEILENALLSNHPDISTEQKMVIQAKLKVLLNKDYSYPSSVILDHNPTNEILGDRGPVSILADREKFKLNELSFTKQQDDSMSDIPTNQPVSFNELLSIANFATGANSPTNGFKGLKTIMQSKNVEGSFLNPVTSRPLVGSLINTPSLLQEAISACIMKDIDFLNNLSGIPLDDLKPILKLAQLTSAKDPRIALKNAVTTFYEKPDCAKKEEDVLTPSTLELSADVQKIAVELVKSGLDIKKTIDENRAFKNIQTSCKACHNPESKDYFGIDIQFPKTKEDMAKFARYKIKSSGDSPLMRIFDKSMPADKQLEAQDREEMMIYILRFLK